MYRSHNTKKIYYVYRKILMCRYTVHRPWIRVRIMKKIWVVSNGYECQTLDAVNKTIKAKSIEVHIYNNILLSITNIALSK